MTNQTLVLYYSQTGNNKYITKQLSDRLAADIQEIRPRFDWVPMQIFLSKIKRGSGLGFDVNKLAAYDQIVICGPIYMGMLLAPLRQAMQVCKRYGKSVYFVSCSGTSDDERATKYGYDDVFDAAREVLGGLLASTTAIPVTLAEVEKPPATPTLIRLSDDNYSPAIEHRIDEVISLIEKRDLV